MLKNYHKNRACILPVYGGKIRIKPGRAVRYNKGVY